MSLTMTRPSSDDAVDIVAPPSQAPTSHRRLYERGAFIALLVATAAFYFWNLTINSYGNDFYAAAVQSGTHSWKAFLFGSADWSNAITVDKTPASLWPMEIFGRIFGFSSWSMLAPNVLEGVASVALVYLAVKRWFGSTASLLAGAILAITPVAALMFRFNNPDAALTFLLVASAYCMTRALEAGHLRWMLLTGVCLGFGFLAKELQAMLVIPGLGLAYLVCAPTSLRRRIVHLVTGLATMIASAGWWIAVALLWPSASRPYFGGSQHNSIIEVILGGNGLSRISGASAGGGGGGANFSGTPGLFRLFNSLMGGEISWLLPAALLAFGLLIYMTLHTARTNRARAALLIWGGWFFVTALTFSFMSGTVHTYYTVALAPAIAVLLGIVATRLWETRSTLFGRLSLAAMLASTAAWGFELLNRTPDWHPWLRFAIVGLATVATLGIWFAGSRKRFGLLIATFALAGSLLGPAAYALDTVNTSHQGSIPTSGPATASAMGKGTGGGGGSAPQGQGGNTTSAELVKLLQTDASKYKWAAATMGSQSSAPLQLAAKVPVMSMGGFTGSDPSPTLAEFQTYLAAGQIHYFIAGGGMGGGGMGGNSSIATWVAAHYTATSVGGTTVYDLTATQTS